MGLLIFLVLIVIAVILHEFGHFIAARHFGVVADEFNIGMGPKITGKRMNGTEWNLRILPFGGSCVLNDEKLMALSPQKRIAIFFAGPFVNFALSFFCFMGFRLLSGNMMILTDLADWIRNVFGIIPSFFSSFVQAFSPNAPTMTESGRILKDTIVQQKTSIDVVIYLLKLSFSLNAFLFIGNILPIPALDGGQIALSIPACFHRPLSEKAVSIANGVFYIGIMTLSAAFLIKDIAMTLLKSNM